ncbi:MAG: DPP IV N-terminal domain-containing protein [Ignavibacteria bacterium]|jgi:tricorn protease
MKKTLTAFLFLSLSIIANEPYFTTYPNLSPDGKTIIFSYNEDLWTVPASGGKALRVTGMQGIETHAAYSPDGKWIAFTARQDGNSNVYLVPVNGGNIKQLTFNDGSDYVESWSWNSRYIYFSSNRYNNSSIYKVSIDGGTPERLFEQFFNWPHNFVVHPKTGEYFFNESWESSMFVNRKRYKGAFNPDIKSYNPSTGEYKKLTNYEGKDMLPTIDEKGKLYFISDEANDEFNLYTFENSAKTQLTNFTTSIKRPKVNAKGGYVVFEKDYQTYLYNVDTKTSGKVEIAIYDNNTLQLSKEYNTAKGISNFDVSPDGKKIVFVSRGELFVSDIEGKFVKQLKTNPVEKVVEVKWLKDNETVMFTQTVNGWENLFTIKADGSGKEKQITFDKANNRQLDFNSDKTKGVYFSGRNELRVIDLETLKSETIVKDEFWAIYTTPAKFSPDDKYLAYVAYRDFEHDIFVYNFDKKKSEHITKTGVGETSPYWSPDGKYIY